MISVVRRHTFWLLGAALLIAAAAGCSKKSTPFNADVPPVTRVFLIGQLDTVSYRTRLHWSGDDPDGIVTGYQIQFQPGSQAPVDSAWRFTTVVDSIFALPISSGVGSFTFWVRAVDDKGTPDPKPASMYLHFRNTPPTVQFINSPRRGDGTTYHFLPVVTLQWQGADFEGNGSIRSYHLWLDGGTFDTTFSRSDTVFTLRVEDFGDVSTTRARTAYLCAIDEATAVGDTTSFTWIVDAFNVGTPRVLLVDNYNPDPKFTVNTSVMDVMYRQQCSQLTAGQYVTLDLFDVDGFRYPSDANELFRHFDLVVWYDEGGGQVPLAPALAAAEPGLMNYLNAGGRMFLSDISVVGQDHLLDDAFHEHYLGVHQTYCGNPNPPQPTCNYSLRSYKLYAGDIGAPTDSLGVSSGFGSYADLFIPSDSARTEFYIPQSAFAEDTTASGYVTGNHVGIVTRTLPSGGRVTFSSIPLNQLDKFSNRDAVVQRLLQALASGSSSPRHHRLARR